MTKMYVNVGKGQTVKLRKAPSTTAPTIINIPHGTLVEAQKHNTTWHKLTVNYRGRHAGFMMSKYLSTHNPINNNPTPKPPENKYPIAAVVDTRKHGNGGSLSLRKHTNTNSEAILSIQNGEHIQVTKLQGIWLAAKHKGKEGYVMAKYIRNSDEYKKSTSPTPPTPPTPPPVNKYPITTKVDSNKHGTGHGITLYWGPNENTGEKLRIDNGESIQVAKLQDTWLAAKYKKDEGYVLAKYIQNSDEYKKQAPPKPPVNPYAINSQVDISQHGSGTVINLYETPSNSSKVLITIPNAESIQLKSLQGTWLAAKYKGKEGYVLGIYVKNAEQWKKPYPIQAYVDSSKHGTGHAITLYSNPQGYGPELARIDNGKEIWLSRRDGTWLAVKYGQHTGFVEAKFVKGSNEYGKNPVEEYPILAKVESNQHGNGGAIDLYAQYSHKVEISIPNGSSIRVNSLKGGLLKAQYKKDGNPQSTYTGFVLARYVQDSEEHKKPSIHNYPNSGRIESDKHGTGGAVDLYYYPSDSGRANVTIPNDTSVRVKNLTEEWCSIYYLTNAHPPRIQVGFVMAKYVLNSDEYKKDPANPYLISSKIDSKKHGKGQAVALHEIGAIHGGIRSIIPNGSTIAVKTLQGEWLSCIYNGKTGYVEAKYVKDSTVYNNGQNLKEEYPYILKVNPLWSKNIGYTKLKNSNYTGPIATSMPRAQGFSTGDINIPRGEYLRAASLSGKTIKVNYKGRVGHADSADLEGSDEQERLLETYKIEAQVEPFKLSHDKEVDLLPTENTNSLAKRLLFPDSIVRVNTLKDNILQCYYRDENDQKDEGYIEAKYIRESDKYREDGYNTETSIKTKDSQDAEIRLHTPFQAPSLTELVNGTKIFVKNLKDRPLLFKYKTNVYEIDPVHVEAAEHPPENGEPNQIYYGTLNKEARIISSDNKKIGTYPKGCPITFRIDANQPNKYLVYFNGSKGYIEKSKVDPTPKPNALYIVKIAKFHAKNKTTKENLKLEKKWCQSFVNHCAIQAGLNPEEYTWVRKSNCKDALDLMEGEKSITPRVGSIYYSRRKGSTDTVSHTGIVVGVLSNSYFYIVDGDYRGMNSVDERPVDLTKNGDFELVTFVYPWEK